MKISKRDVSLLIGFVGILIGFLAYQFGYVRINEKVEAMETQNTQMRTEISQLEALQANQTFYEEETTRMDGEITEKVNEFACDVLPEDEMKFAYQQDSTATIGTRLFVTSMSFADPDTGRRSCRRHDCRWHNCRCNDSDFGGRLRTAE